MRVQIALPSDENYVCGLLVTAASIATHANKEATLVFNILDGGIKDSTFSDFEKRILEINPKCEFRRLRIDESVFAGFPAWSGNRMTYARLMLANLLPDVDHVIYCDTDFLWLTDIVDLWKLRDDSVVLQSTRDGAPETEKGEGDWFRDRGYDFNPERYFCAGLSFYNLRLFREEAIIKQVSDFLVAHPDVRMADQTAMNAILGNRVRILPSKWQRFSRDLTNEDLREGCAIHYAGEVPWRKLGFWTNTITDTMLIWHRVNAQICGISLWRSLRLWYSTYEIIKRRSLFVITSGYMLKKFFFGMLRLTKRDSYIGIFERWCRPINWSPTV